MGRAYLAGAQRASCWRLEETRWVRCEVTDLGRGAGDGRGEEVELEAVGAAVAGGGELSGGIAAEALTGGGEGAAGEEHGCGIGDDGDVAGDTRLTGVSAGIDVLAKLKVGPPGAWASNSPSRRDVESSPETTS